MCTRVTMAEVKKLQKAAGIITEGEDYDLNEKMQTHITDEICNKNLVAHGPYRAYSCGPGTDDAGDEFCWPTSWPMNLCCNHNPRPAGSKPYPGTKGCEPPVHNLSESNDLDEGVPPSPCPPLPDGIKRIPFSTGPKPTDFVCLRADSKLTLGGKPLQKKLNAHVPTPRFGAQPLTK